MTAHTPPAGQRALARAIPRADDIASEAASIAAMQGRDYDSAYLEVYPEALAAVTREYLPEEYLKDAQ
jgi:hypothetical protein